MQTISTCVRFIPSFAHMSGLCNSLWRKAVPTGGLTHVINHDYLEFHFIIFVLLNSTSDGSVTSCLHWANFKRRHAINGLKGKIYEIWLVWRRTVRVENRREGWVFFDRRPALKLSPVGGVSTWMGDYLQTEAYYFLHRSFFGPQPFFFSWPAGLI